ncbi:hypothetical protein L0666_03215 [Octadecabacter sp. CECT 8868]|uniref:hypothetical protein n=1 Tax=Octadecabacter algicola TaxID=2909342 RepID=UPI001F3F386F|nr:hypothetical protein [Octadecabacter algicola]MCF2903986.1 hypothetical protein [Octadecabacter algicola]
MSGNADWRLVQKQTFLKVSIFKTAVAVTLAAFLGASQSSAQAADFVTLQTFDGSNAISGQLVGVEGDYFRIDTLVGVLEVRIDTVECVGAACPALVPDFVVGEVVTLTSKDRTTNITGQVVSLDDVYVTVNAGLLGEVALERAKVDCSGPNCHPTLMVESQQEPASTSSILRALLDDTGN